jgi:ASC-1-like (ASCH) protein
VAKQVKTLWIKDVYLAQILAGKKTVEVRVAYANIARLQVGDSLLLNEKYHYTIRRIGRYDDFDKLLKREDPQTIAPGIPADELLERMRAIYPPEKEAMGVIALEIYPA